MSEVVVGLIVGAFAGSIVTNATWLILELRRKS